MLRIVSAVITSSGAPVPQSVPIQKNHSITILGSQVQIVEHGDNRNAGAAVQVADQTQDGLLMSDVEVTCRFIQQKDLGLLGQAHGKQLALTFAPADLGNRPIGEVGNVREVHGVSGRCVVVLAFIAEPGQMRRPSH